VPRAGRRHERARPAFRHLRQGSLPADLHEAIGLAEGSKVLRDALVEHVHEFLIRNKREEWDSYKSYVTPYELERYLPIL